MTMKTITLLAAALLGTTFAGASLAQETGDDGRPGYGRGHGHHGVPQPGEGRALRGPGGRGGPALRAFRSANLVEGLDSDGDSLVSVDEFSAARLPEVDRVFERLDRDGDGRIAADELDRPRRPGRRERRGPPRIDREALIACIRETIADYDPPAGPRFDNADTDGDGFIDLAELSAALDERAHNLFDRLDADGDGFISEAEFTAHHDQQLNLRRVRRACLRELAGAPAQE